MKIIVVGLGNFGGSIASKLTLRGNEVIGIDLDMNKVEHYKEKVSHTIRMDATDEATVSGLPLKDTDIVIVAIGEDQGVNVMVTALFKNFKVKRLISRSINTLHEKVLVAIGVDDIARPEQETAERWAKKLCFKGVVDSFELTKDFSIVEADVPKKYLNQTIGDINLREKYKILILTILKKEEVETVIGQTKTNTTSLGVPPATYVLQKADILVLYGSNEDIQEFLKTN
ncbi:potassium channel family protein [Flavimarina sp. Hel_I_48]|uniref:potassium channel family protein n=1 Tax=Flavimarina sp. Hel_I_48 TaxID=1392488 RepID=UPI0004DF4CAC|nr:TrkA family potassium uptake protein [Flavimarina sp. Hel_I_48]